VVGDKKMKMTYHNLSRNILNWNNGTHTLEIRYRGTREELLQKRKGEIEKELTKDA
jgi:hypothetical protein